MGITKKMNYILGALLILSLSSCITYNSYLPAPIEEISLDLPIQIQSINIIDQRESINSEKDISLPLWSRPNMLIVHRPALTQTYKSIIEQTIYNNVANTNAIMVGEMKVYINEAFKQFTSSWTGEKETVKIDIQIVFIDSKTKIKYEGATVEEFFYQALDAKPNHFEELFQSSLSNVILQSLSKLKPVDGGKNI